MIWFFVWDYYSIIGDVSFTLWGECNLPFLFALAVQLLCKKGNCLDTHYFG